jgi:glycerol 3-phosphatase-1
LLDTFSVTLSPYSTDCSGIPTETSEPRANGRNRHGCNCKTLAQVSRAQYSQENLSLSARFRLGKELGVDPNIILATSHGRRSIDVLKLYDARKANWDYISHVEGLIPREFGQDATEILGARKFLASLDRVNAPWAVVTSGTRALIEGWIEIMKLAHPKHMIVAEDVQIGKPDPSCYLLGRSRLDLNNTSNILVVEDAPSGIKAGKAAGFKVIGLTTTHSLEQVRDAGADWIVRDLRDLTVQKFEKGLVEIEITNAYVD